MILKCKVLCFKEEKGAIEELNTSEDIWLEAAIDLKMIVSIKQRNQVDKDQCVLHLPGDLDNYWIIDQSFEYVYSLFEQAK